MKQNMPIFSTYIKKHLQSIPIFKRLNSYLIPLVQTNILKTAYKIYTEGLQNIYCETKSREYIFRAESRNGNAIVVIFTRFNQIVIRTAVNSRWPVDEEIFLILRVQPITIYAYSVVLRYF